MPGVSTSSNDSVCMDTHKRYHQFVLRLIGLAEQLPELSKIDIPTLEEYIRDIDKPINVTPTIEPGNRCSLLLETSGSTKSSPLAASNLLKDSHISQAFTPPHDLLSASPAQDPANLQRAQGELYCGAHPTIF